MAAPAHFVQFPHPQFEPPARTNLVPWNSRKQHYRKFLLSPGRYVTDIDGPHEPTAAELAFWGEWEPPSCREERWPRSDELPRFLHRPHWTRLTDGAGRQNTDPWVWGDRMLYSNCKQAPGGRPNWLQRLEPGSVICFGSTIGGDFCVDTVFVVARGDPWDPADAAHLGLDDAFLACTASPLSSWQEETGTCRACGSTHESPSGGCGPRRRAPRRADRPSCPPDQPVAFTLYRGATVDDPVDGMFSFVPARPADGGNVRFARPAVDLGELLNPTSVRSPRGAKEPRAIDDLRRAWTSVAQQVLAADLVLATWFEPPMCDDDPSCGRR